MSGNVLAQIAQHVFKNQVNAQTTSPTDVLQTNNIFMAKRFQRRHFTAKPFKRIESIAIERCKRQEGIVNGIP